METMNLGMLINELEKIKLFKDNGEFKIVCFDFCTAIPTNFDSWRGSYDLLALNYKLTGRDDSEGLQYMRADDFLKMCKDANGQTFTGYKGGEFTMGKHTDIWVDNYGSFTETGLVGVESDDYCIYLKTAKVEY